MNAIRQIQSSLIQLLYWVCRVVAFPLLVFYFVYRCARDTRYIRHFPERLGAGSSSFQATPPGSIWLHAVSVGEVISAAALLQELRERNPAVPLYVSVGTVAGRILAVQKLGGLVEGIFYAPIDYAFAVRRVLRRIRPSVVVILETEIWPVFYRQAKRAGASLLVVNGRISDRAFPRYRQWRFFFRTALEQPDAIFVQSEQDRARYIEVGAPAENVHTIGNIKYDAKPVDSEPSAFVRKVIQRLTPSTVWIAASTMPPAASGDVDEDDAVLRAFRSLAKKYPRLLLILVPRRPERFDAAEEKLRDAQIPYLRRSLAAIPAGLTLPCVLLLDSIGELASLFSLADVVFMGGSLARRGGHNILEPAACSRAIVTGPHMENFAAIAKEFREQRAFHEIAEPIELAPAVEKLIEDPALRQDLGVRAAELARKHRGATKKAAAEILRWQDATVPSGKPGALARPLLWLLSKIWIAGSHFEQRSALKQARRLDTPVVSIGGLSMGGSGKTPVVDYLAERMNQRGHHPAILTRGYRRRSIAPSIVIGAGELVPVSITGDEAQIFVHSGYAHAGIGRDRWATGRVIEERYHPDIFILDDGFQHRRLIRDLDIVLIDTLNPLAGGVFPMGHLREPVSALARADAFMLMRAAPEREYLGLRNLLHTANPKAPIFRATIEPRYWVNHRTQREEVPPDAPVAAFCGLGNPASFWTTLKALGIHPAFRWTFDDHHRYNCMEIHRLAEQARMHGSTILLCTEKDAMNLPEQGIDTLTTDAVELYWLKVGLRIENEETLIGLIESKLRHRSPIDVL